MISSAKWNYLYFIFAGIARYLIKDLSVSFLIIHKVPTITGPVIILRCHIFSISISKSFLSFIYYYIHMPIQMKTIVQKPWIYKYHQASSQKFQQLISKSLYLLILLYSFTDILLFVSTDLSIRKHVFLL